MDRAATALQLQQFNSRHAARNGDASAGPEWRRYGQARGYLRPLERVCGTEADIAAMRENSAASGDRSLFAWKFGALVALVAAWLQTSLD